MGEIERELEDVLVLDVGRHRLGEGRPRLHRCGDRRPKTEQDQALQRLSTGYVRNLQDIHWPGGGFGYFPTYTLGAIMAAQLFQAACEAESNLLSMLARGNFEPLVAWLKAEIHSRGSFLDTDDLLTAANGRPLDTTTFQNHLERRYI